MQIGVTRPRTSRCLSQLAGLDEWPSTEEGFSCQRVSFCLCNLLENEFRFDVVLSMKTGSSWHLMQSVGKSKERFFVVAETAF